MLSGCAVPTGGSSAASGTGGSGIVASDATAANVRRVGFLTDYARLRPMPGGGGMLCWRDAGADWKQYNKVLFERIQVYLKPGSSQPVDPTDLKMLIDYFHSDLVKAIQPEAQVVNAAAPGVFPLGPRGAGVCATVGKWLRDPYQLERSGQGAAVHAAGAVRIAAFAVVNAVGALVDRSGRAVRGHLDPGTGKRVRVGEVVSIRRDAEPMPEPPPGNTTLSLIITNQAMSLRELNQMARQVHSSMARAIDPFHTMYDGDVLYCVTTNAIDPAPLKYNEVSYIASELAWDAVLSCF